jgi:hypothetical protein
MITFICVCVNYSDYLQETLKHNSLIFDNIFIVTTPSDDKTKEIINQYPNIKYIETEIFYKDSCPFNKGAGLNLGLQNIEKKDWLLIGDADCIYPNSLQNLTTDLDKNCLYGMRREIVNSPEVLDDILTGKYKPKPRLEKAMHYTPGYFQLFNISAEKFLNKSINYPEFPTAQRVDRWFAKYNFAHNERKIIDNEFVIHLGPTIINWSGRKSDLWR